MTALPRYIYPALKGQPDIWSNANFRDAFPMVLSTLFWGITRIVTQKMFGETFKEAGYAALPGLQYARLFKGRVYMNISLLQWEYFDAFGFTPRETNEFIGGHQPEIEVPESEARGGLKAWKKQWRKLRIFLAIKRVERKAGAAFADARNFVGQCLKRDWKGLSDQEIVTAINEINDISNPRWKEDPSYLLNFIRGILDTSDAGRIKSQQREKRDKVWQEINRKVPLYRTHVHYLG